MKSTAPGRVVDDVVDGRLEHVGGAGASHLDQVVGGVLHRRPGQLCRSGGHRHEDLIDLVGVAVQD